MLPFLSQPAVAPACYVPRAGSVIGQSQVFNGGQSLKRAMAAGDPTRWTFVTYFCPADVSGTTMSLFAARGVNDASGRPHEANIELTGNVLAVYDFGRVAGGTEYQKSTTMVFRDPSAFHQLVVSLDTNLGNADDRLKIELDGVRVSSFGTSINPAIGFAAGSFNSATVHGMGVDPNLWADRYPFKGLQASPMFISGHSLPASTFGEFNIHGVWVAKSLSEIYAAVVAAGGFGANGFHLNFSDPLNPGKDVSGNGNHWTAAGFDATGKDTVASSPTNVYATLNPLISYIDGAFTLSDGNLSVSSVAQPTVLGTIKIPEMGCYFEGTYSSGMNVYIGINNIIGNVRTAAASHGAIYVDGVETQAGLAAWSSGDVIGVTVNGVGKIAQFYRNGVPYGATVTYTSSHDLFPFFRTGASVPSSYAANFGQRAWVYAPPAGFKALCTDNLPEPEVKDPTEGYASATATGANILAVLDASTAHWVGAPYVEWLKCRDKSGPLTLRATAAGLDKASQLSTAEPEAAFVAPTADNWVGVRWRVGKRFGCTALVVDKAGVAAQSFAHDLGAVPAMMWVKPLGGGDALMYHKVTGGTHSRSFSGVSSMAANTAAWNNAAPTASQITLGTAFPAGRVLVVLFAEVPGFSAFGRHRGNSSADGAFVPGGILPELFMACRIESADNLPFAAAAMNPANPVTNWLFLDRAAVDPSPSAMQADFVVGGVKMRGSDSSINSSSFDHLSAMWGRPVGGICVAPATVR